MKSWEVEEMARKSGYKDGFDDGFNDGFNDASEKINQLNLHLIESNRMDDLAKAARDASYREQLMKEFDLL